MALTLASPVEREVYILLRLRSLPPTGTQVGKVTQSLLPLPKSIKRRIKGRPGLNVIEEGNQRILADKDVSMKALDYWIVLLKSLLCGRRTLAALERARLAQVAAEAAERALNQRARVAAGEAAARRASVERHQRNRAHNARSVQRRNQLRSGIPHSGRNSGSGV